MQGKGFLNPYTMGYLPHGKCSTHVSSSSADNNTLENLNSFLVAFNDTDMHLDGVAGTEVRHIMAHLFSIDSFNYICTHSLYSRFLFVSPMGASRSPK